MSEWIEEILSLEREGGLECESGWNLDSRKIYFNEPGIVINML